VADTYSVALLERQSCGADIQTLRFERPSGYVSGWGVVHAES
jgi:hypothetical protein